MKKKVADVKQPHEPKKEKAVGLQMVIAVRHGEYSQGGQRELDSKGRKQSEMLACKLKEIIPSGYKVVVLSSVQTRGLQTAEIIAYHLGVAGVKSIQALSEDQHEYGEYAKEFILKAVGDAHVVIAVTHYTLPSGIIHAFSMKHFQRGVPEVESGKGNGLMLDLISGKVVLNLFSD